MSDILIETIDLKKYFDTPRGKLHAVDGVNFKIKKGTTLGVVGESGCGKSTLGNVILQLLDATDGKILFKGQDITSMSKKEFRDIRTKMQLIFQDPFSSLDPRKSVEEAILEPLKLNKVYKTKEEYAKRVRELMDTVGLAERYATSYPHELDGGRRQRIGIARALALDPEFIVCDEPVSALDVSIQAQILNLLMNLQEEKELTYMFITHDLSVVKHISTDIAVMYLGNCVEYATSDELFAEPLHPYTKGLLEAIPIPSLTGKKLNTELMQGELKSPIEPEPGCRFANRCSKASEKCKEKNIPLYEVKEGHFVACVLFEEGLGVN